MPANKKKKRIWLVIIIVIIAAVIGYLYISAKNARNNMANSYEAVEVTVQDMQATVRGSGTVESGQTLDVYAPANVTISEVYVEEGDEIKTGDRIAKIDADAYLEAESAIEDSIGQIDNSISALYSSKGSTAIYSSVKGTVKQVYVSQDDYIEAVMNSSGSLMVISSDNNMRLEVTVEDTHNYEIGQNVKIHIGDKITDAVITDINMYESMLKIIFKDDGYTAGDTAMVFDENNAEIGNAEMMINVPVYVTGNAGIARYIYVKENTAVSRGTKLLSIKENEASAELITLTEQKAGLQKQLDDLRQGLYDIGMGKDYVIYSSAEGIIDQVMLEPYMTVVEGTKIFSVQTTDTMELKIPIDELDISKVKLGQVTELKFEALDGEKYEGIVTKINSLGEAVNGVTNYTIVVTMENPGNVLIGMSGTAKIVTEYKEDVITVPLEAVQIIDNEYYVILGKDANGKTVADHKILTGINDGAYIEVLNGLSAGDTVAMPVENGLDIQFGPNR